MRAQERFDLDELQYKNDAIQMGEHSKSGGFLVTRLSVFVTFTIFLFLLCAAILITYNFGICSNINVQSEVCDKKNVIPITIAINNSQPTTEKIIRFEEDLHLSNRTNVRLPRTMHPITYELKLMPFLFMNNFTFNGDVRIVVNVTKSCRNVTLHAIALKIGDISVWKIGNATQTGDDRTQVDILSQYAIESDQFYVIVFATDLDANNTYEINIKYTGILNDMLQGFYRSSYVINNETR